MTLDVDADPEEEEEGAEAHEDGRHGRDHHLLLQLAGELGRGHLHTQTAAPKSVMRPSDELLYTVCSKFTCKRLAKMRQNSNGATEYLILRKTSCQVPLPTNIGMLV